MFDTMTQTKIIAGLCGTWLVLLLGGWLAETIYHSGGHHGDDHHYAYVIEPEDDHGGDVVEEPAVPFADLLAVADVETGAQLFQRQCSACHSSEAGGNGVGPYLHGVVDRNISSVDGYSYSGSLVAVAEVWTTDNLNAFIEAPGDWASGTAMSYGGLDEAEDRAHLIAYLDSLDD